MRIANIIAYILVLLGALNWGLVGFFDFNLVTSIFNGGMAAGAVIVYTLIALAALWLILSPFITDGVLLLRNRRAE
ncbi:MAG: DUF378 domain-containing protein [Clostridiales bacterium]|jgi:uncharacterized membrane protein YuzA (DUF378 family)|nr:DUF378 domain-containing protein [Clostridiales bacterium]